jgi:4-diphosphocytidyl-2-C-methyl-D-erythritol kinase
MAGKRVRQVRAFAKINLSLRVLGVRPDGYHELRTILQSIELHDTLTIRAAPGPFQLTCDDPECPSNSTNLIWRAAEQLWSASGRRGSPRDISIDLAKRIPLQAGLGGGSSDAAATLRALGRMWRIDEAHQRAIAAALGADVPYFFEGGTVLGLERGDLLFPLLDYPAAWVVIALPPFGVSTRDAFWWWDGMAGGRAFPASARSESSSELRGLAEAREARRPKASRFRSAESLALRPGESQARRGLQNDLEEAAAAHHPQIKRLISAMRRAGASHAAMSGSGSAVFGLFARRTEAVAAAEALGSSRSGRGIATMITRTVNRTRYQALAAT